MSRKDVYHDTVRRALEAEGWTITHDPLTVKFGEQSVFVDLGAEGPIAAERSGRRIAVEVKSFLGTSPITDLERALGQYGLYRVLVARQHPDRALYLAVPVLAYSRLLDTADGRDVVAGLAVRLIVFDEITETIRQWIE